ncbi:hypothetical protein [Candidatus Brachybacter algidus]|uniref:hypothetical protein n=1 Tax=Candidatus Brachybacter algidus TaxID=2982024 RepID=UPI0025809F08|nr:hypothetical protein [Candidatus Brachybacter algidus]
MGISTTYYDFTVGRLKAGSDDGSISFSSGIDRTGMEYGLYVSDEFEIIKTLKLMQAFVYQDGRATTISMEALNQDWHFYMKSILDGL